MFEQAETIKGSKPTADATSSAVGNYADTPSGTARENGG
jgi:hypothetical protein